MNRRFKALSCYCAFAVASAAMVAALPTEAAALARHKPAVHHKKAEGKKADAKKSEVKTSDAKAATHKRAATSSKKKTRRAKGKTEKTNTAKAKTSDIKTSDTKTPDTKRPDTKTSDRVAAASSEPEAKSEAAAPAAAAALTGDLAAVKQAIDLVRKGKTADATALKKSITDPVAQRLVEWQILRHPAGEANFNRYAAFVADNPNW